MPVVEGMISLSRLIKSRFTNDQEKKEIKIQTINLFAAEEENSEEIGQEFSYRAAQLIESAQHQAEEMIGSAQNQLAEIRQQIEEEQALWNEQRELLIEEAKREGYAEGMEIGRTEALAEHQGLIDHAKGIIERSEKDYIEKIESSEETILQLSVKIAEKIILSQLSEDPVIFVNIVKQVLKEVKEYENIKIHVHPLNYELVLNQKNELMSILTSETDLYIYANDEVEENGCYIESPYGRIDASIDTQLFELKQQLIELLGEE